jgi:hypothetical protein
MTEDDEIDSWADSVGALDFLRDLKLKRRAQVDSLIGAASVSPDPLVRANWGALSQLDIIIKAMEDERGKHD